MSHDPRQLPRSFALIIVNYGSAHLLLENLAQLNLEPLNGNVVVVDNYTTATERASITELSSARNWLLVPLERNYGFGIGVNEGAKAAIALGAQNLVVLNPDASIGASELQLLLQAVEADPWLMVSPLIRTSSGATWFDGMDLFTDTGEVASQRRPKLPAGPRKPWLSGACFAISAALWEVVGGFDPDYFLYWEDVDFSHRVVGCGGQLAVLETAVAVHDSGGTQTSIGGAETKSESYYFHNIRNRLVYAAKHVHGRQLRNWIWATPRVSYQILLAGGRKQLITSPAPLRAYASGIILGFALLIKLRLAQVPEAVSWRRFPIRFPKMPLADAGGKATSDWTKP